MTDIIHVACDDGGLWRCSENMFNILQPHDDSAETDKRRLGGIYDNDVWGMMADGHRHIIAPNRVARQIEFVGFIGMAEDNATGFTTYA